MNTLIAKIPKIVSGGRELIVVKRDDFDAFLKWKEEINDALAKIKRGRIEHRSGRTIVASSPIKFR